MLDPDVDGFPSGNQPPPTVNINSNMLGSGPGNPYGFDAGNFLTFVTSGQTLRDTGQSTLTMLGAPKLVGYQYDASTYAAYSNYTNAAMETDRGYIGAGETISFTGERFTEAPTITQLLFGIFNFMQFTAEGGQHIIDMIYELVSFQDYAWKYSGHGFYINTNAPLDGEVSRLLVNKARYIGPSIQNLTANVKINNLQRPSTVAISAIQTPDGFGFRLPTATEDDSRFKIGDFSGWFNPSQWQVRNIAAHYTALKVAFKNQYGQLDQIKQIPVGLSLIHIS